MGTLQIKNDLSKDLTLVKAQGGMTADDFLGWEANYITKGATGLILWDLLRADMCKLSRDEIRGIVTGLKGLLPRGGKTAFVLKRPCDFMVGKRLEADSMVGELPSAFRTFRSLEDAQKWLGI